MPGVYIGPSDAHKTGGVWARIREAVSPGTQFTCFTSTKVQILTPRSIPRYSVTVTCFTSTKVQILTPEELRARRKQARKLCGDVNIA
jgi:hypothetical protein